ncbi:sporulation protein Cse60 [Clostridium sp.]|uniref:sporulation protein Cse60 n=1 Tax=Clostridium sp. TaxID=1506 RepID=UPI0029116480|nr:sporulation protein Cse60 [Clostridium sp.]MDU7243283.1 sporulation protein Cse60 [Clostridium sp.]
MIAVFSYDTPYQLEQGINNWLENKDISILDIKFSTSVCYCVDSIVNNYSAMVIYEDN